MRAYREEDGVPPASATETFAALRLFVDNWRWQDVPFYLRTGKALGAPALDGDDAAGPPVRIHGIDIDPARRRVRIEGLDVELTDQEFRLLHLLATHAGIVFSREALLTFSSESSIKRASSGETSASCRAA